MLLVWIALGALVLGVLQVAPWLSARASNIGAEVYDPDPAQRARNLKRAREAWRRGENFINPNTLARLERASSEAHTSLNASELFVFAEAGRAQESHGRVAPPLC